MKKSKIITLLLILALSLTALITGCGGHEHDFKAVTTVSATCETEGYVKYICSCGEENIGDRVSALGHDLETISGKDSTCLVKGFKEHKACKNCDYKVGYEELPLAEHELITVEEVAGDCATNTNGHITKACKNCDYTKTTQVKATHKWKAIPAQSANCYQEGYNAHSKCENCGATSNKVTIIPKKHGEIINVAEKKSTCTEKGYYAHTKCSICGEEFNKQEMPLYAHSTYEETIIEREPTCYLVGIKVVNEYCHNCDYQKEKAREDIQTTEHDIELVMAKDSTCYEVGYYNYEYCKNANCNYNTYQEIPVKEHSLQKYSGKSPTCLEGGYKEYEECSNDGCNYTTFEELGPLDHEITKFSGKEATCIKGGYEPYETCSRCDYTTYKETYPLDHDLGIVERANSTCLEEGHESYYKCKRAGCNYTMGYIEIPKEEHEFETNELGQLECIKCQTIENLLDILVDGVPQYKIYYADSVATQAGWLNNELNRYVGWTFSKATLPMYRESDKVICIGNNVYSKSAGMEYYNNRDTAFNVMVKNDAIFILGSDTAMRFGVYELLKILIGYEKYSIYANNLGEEVAYVKSDNITLGVSQIVREINPDVQYLIGANSGNTYDGSLGANDQRNSSMGFIFSHHLNNGTGSNDDGVTESLKYKITAGHNTLGFFPVKKYCNKTLNPNTYHPEWFAKTANGSLNMDGDVEDPRQVCFYGLAESEEAVQVAFNVVEHWGQKGWKTITMSNMDEGGDCLCEHCNNNWAYQYFRFLNKLSAKMANDTDTENMTLKGWLYHVNCSVPPLDSNGRPTISLNDNVEILFAFDYADYYEGFSAKDEALLEKWGKVLPEMHFWTYCFKPGYSMFFFDDFTNKQRAFELMAKYGALSLYDEGAKPAPQYTNFSALRVYLESRLSVDSGLTMSDADAKAYYESITKEWFDNYFGAGSTAMRKVFEKQKERAQYMHDNWSEGDNLYKKSFIDTGVFNKQSEYFKTKIQPVNEFGNNIVGTYSSWAFHNLAYYYSPLAKKNVGNHANRACYAVVYTKQDFKDMLSWFDEAVDAINSDDSISASKKEILINRTQLEKIGVLYQYMFIFEDQFAIGNNSYKSSFDASDLSAVGATSVEQAVQYFATLCKKYSINSLNASTLQDLISGWNYKYGWNIAV